MSGSYQDKSAYAKYLKQGCSGSEPCSGCSESTVTQCLECCPPGLVSVRNVKGEHIACLTPADAEEFNLNNPPVCSDGYVALYDKSFTPPRFVACVESSEFVAINDSLNPVAP